MKSKLSTTHTILCLALATLLGAACGSSKSTTTSDAGDGGPDTAAHETGGDTAVPETGGDAGPDAAVSETGGDTTEAGADATEAGADTTEAGADATEAGAEAGGCPATGTGQLAITVMGLPTGTVPMVRIMGGKLATPMGLAAGAPLTLDAGPGYQIAWRRVKVAPVAPAILGKAYYLSNMPFDGCVKAGETTTVTLQYTQEPGSEKMWWTVSNAPTLGNFVAGFNGADVAATGVKAPAVWKSKNFTGRGAAGAVDSSGNLWVPGGDRINQYAMASLAMTTDAAPAVTLTQPAGASASFAAFDADGNLWISRGAPTAELSVVRYDAAQLAASGAPTPVVVLKSAGFMNPSGIAFDKDGDLWVADEGNDKVFMFLRAHLAASATLAADVALTARSTTPTVPVAGTYTNPIPIAFDKNDDLWVGFVGNLVKITKAQQAASADLANPASLNWAAGSGAFAFDESGGLWMGGPTPGKFQRLPKTELDKAAATVPAPTADIVMDSTAMLGYAESVVIDPAPTWSNLHDNY